jgi:NtrC-family two-component system response regulator AlgB
MRQTEPVDSKEGLDRQSAAAQGALSVEDKNSSPTSLRVLIIDDEANIRTTLTMCLEADGHTVAACGSIHETYELIARRVFDLVLLDLRLGMDNGLDFLSTLRAQNPWAQVVVITAYASIETAVEAMKRGAADYLPKPFEPAQVQLVTRKVAQRRQMELKMESLAAAMGAMDAEADLPTESSAMRDAIEIARQVATSNAPVLIRGEVGTGKGRLARAIHAWSNRSQGPFAAVSCLLEADALDAELFGVHSAAGSHGGDKAGGDRVGGERVGRVAFCEGGTLLLDEVGQTPPALQMKLCRLLRDREYERAEGVHPRAANVRIIATTSADLKAAIEAGTFRADLLLSLDVVQVEVPPLRSRFGDIAMLAKRYLAQFNRENHRTVSGFTRDALYALEQYTWPGNVRELRNVIERAVLLVRTEQIGVEHLPSNLLNASPAYAVGDLVPLEVIERDHVLRVVASTRSLRRAAAILGVDSSTVYRWMKRYGTVNDQPAA